MLLQCRCRWWWQLVQVLLLLEVLVLTQVFAAAHFFGGC
jgi:hypothetical protein